MLRWNWTVATARVAAGVVAVLLLSCGGGGSPTSFNPPATPTTQPTPRPPAGGGVGAASCLLGMGSAESSCSRGSSVLLNDVDAAIDATVEQRPAAFDKSAEAVPGTGTYRVLDERAYIEGVVTSLRAKGYCAEPDYDDPLELIHVKSSNEFSEEFDLMLSSATSGGALARTGRHARRRPSRLTWARTSRRPGAAVASPTRPL